MGAIAEKAKSNAVARKNKSLLDVIQGPAMMNQVKKALPSVITPERFIRMVTTAMNTNPQLKECSAESFLGAMMAAAQLGLEPNTQLGQAYIIPYKNKGKQEAQFQIGYKGLIDLAYRSGEVTMIQAHVVYENDDFDYELGLDPKLKHVPAKSNRGEPVYVYAIFKTKSGGEGFECMSMDDVKSHAARYSQAYNSSYSPWKTNFEEMAKKTVLKRVLKYAPLKSDFIRGVAQDETVKSTLDEDMGFVPDEIEYEVEAEVVETEGVDE